MVYLVALLVLVVGTTFGGLALHTKAYKAGYEDRELECKVQLADIASEKAEADRQANAWREKSRILADRLSDDLARAKEALSAQKRRFDDEIKRMASAHRRALDAELVRVLNEQVAVREYSYGEATATATGTAADSAAIAADRLRPSGGASERSVASWIATCGTSYNACRAQVISLVGYIKSVTE